MSKHIPKKRWGQNFLVDSNIINKIISSTDIKPSDSILEIGPGKGAITTLLAEKVKKITAIEIDTNLCKALENKNIPNLKIINIGFFVKNVVKNQSSFSSINSSVSWSLEINFAFCISLIGFTDSANLNCSVAS